MTSHVSLRTSSLCGQAMVAPLPVNPLQSARQPLEIGPSPRQTHGDAHEPIASSPIPIHWGATDPVFRGPVIAAGVLSPNGSPTPYSAIGTHQVDTAIYRVLAQARNQAEGDIPTQNLPIQTDDPDSPEIGPYPSWFDRDKIVSIDPFGADVKRIFSPIYGSTLDIHPTISISKTQLYLPEIQNALVQGWLEEDDVVLQSDGSIAAVQVVLSPVWYLPGVADRLQIKETALRQSLFEHTSGMFPELMDCPALCLFLPPIAPISLYIVGDLAKTIRPASSRSLCVRIHNECTSADVFGAHQYECRSKLVHALETCVETAQAGGAGVIVYRHQKALSQAQPYVLMPDILHWLGITQIDQFLSTNVAKRDAIRQSGIEIVNQVAVPVDWSL